MTRNNASTPVSAEPAGNHCDFHSLLRCACVPHRATVSAACAERYDLAQTGPPPAHHYDFAWMVRCALTGDLPVRTLHQDGRVILWVDFACFRAGQAEPLAVSLGVIATPTTVHVVLPEELAGNSSEPTRVLLVEDDADLAGLMQLLLADAGHHVTHAATGEAGLQLALEWHPHVVVLDVDLPGINGFEVCRRLRSDPATAGIRVVFCSGRPDLGEHAAALGAAAWLAKPQDLPQLVPVVQAAIQSPAPPEKP